MKKKDRRDFYIAIPVILAMIGFVVFNSFSSISITGNKHDSILMENSQDIDEVLIGETVYQPVTTVETRPPISAPAVLTRKRDILPIESHHITPPSTLTTPTSKNSDSSIPLKGDVNATHTTVSDSLIKMDTTKAKAAPKSDSLFETSKSVAALPEETNKQNRIVNKDCIIIIGAYKNIANAANLLNNLVNDDYDAFTVPYKGLTRVGIYHACNKVTLEATLAHVREKYAKDAMVLTKRQ